MTVWLTYKKRWTNVDADELVAKVDKLMIEFDKITNDPETMRESEELHRVVSYLAPKDLFTRFTIWSIIIMQRYHTQDEDDLIAQIEADEILLKEFEDAELVEGRS